MRNISGCPETWLIGPLQNCPFGRLMKLVGPECLYTLTDGTIGRSLSWALILSLADASTQRVGGGPSALIPPGVMGSELASSVFRRISPAPCRFPPRISGRFTWKYYNFELQSVLTYRTGFARLAQTEQGRDRESL